MGVGLGRADVGVAKDALDRADVDALLQEQRRGSVPSVVQAHLPNAGALQQLAPLGPVGTRINAVATPEREHYLAELRAGHGYDGAHHDALVQLQRAQQQARNVEGGYWIAETDPAAAHHGFTSTVERDAIGWAVLATDGAVDFIEHAGHGWHGIAKYKSPELTALLARIYEWEENSTRTAVTYLAQSGTTTKPSPSSLSVVVRRQLRRSKSDD